MNDWFGRFLDVALPTLSVILAIVLAVALLSHIPSCSEPPEKWTPTTWDPGLIEPSLCGTIAALSPEEFTVWMKPRAVSETPWVLACILKEARRVDK